MNYTEGNTYCLALVYGSRRAGAKVQTEPLGTLQQLALGSGGCSVNTVRGTKHSVKLLKVKAKVFYNHHRPASPPIPNGSYLRNSCELPR